MDRRTAVVFYVVAMAAVIVGVDFVFFRNRFWERLIVNIGIAPRLSRWPLCGTCRTARTAMAASGFGGARP
jgi:hypothetical protein